MQYASVVRVPIYNNKKSFGMPLYRAFPKDLLVKYNYVPTFPNEKNIVVNIKNNSQIISKFANYYLSLHRQT